MTFTNFDYQQALIRLAPKQVKASDGVEAEGKLQQEIVNECKRRGWVAIYQRMDKPTRTGKGCPDFIIYANQGRVFTVEAKAKARKVSPEQLGIKIAIEGLGHRVAVVRNMQEFMEHITL